tara:strand:+ start:6946 stop:7437 length:492 start_codon:yes stop_codon:yes gene_type:complete
MTSNPAFDKQVNAMDARRRDLEFRANSGYTLLKVNLIEGQTGHNMICRRPDGYVSDILVKNRTVAHRDMQCQWCGEDFVAKGNGTFVCNNFHPPVVMTTEETTRNKLKPKRPTLIKRIVNKVMPKHSPRTLKTPHYQKSGVSAEKVDMADVKRQVADALEDLL